MIKKNWVNRFIGTMLATVFFAVTAFSQVGTSNVAGVISDPQGNVIAGATVRLIGNQGTNRTVVSNDNGYYAFSSVQPGSYRIEVEMKGFKKASVSEFKAPVDITTTVNVKVEIGEVTETVNVDAAGLESIVNTSDASLGNNFVSQQILQLPIEGRNVANLLSLQPGVTPDGSVTGGRADQANITLDGIDVNNQQNAGAFESVLRVSPDSIEEFRVTTSNPDATKGRSSGAQISLITKSGSNEFRGALFHYHRNTVTTANDWFSNAAGVLDASSGLVQAGLAKAGDMVSPRPKLIRNLFGGRLGGPIVKNRLFFFYHYEGMRESKSVPVTRIVPTQSLAAGQIKFLDSTGILRTISSAQINTFLLTGVPVVDVNPAVVSLFSGVYNKYPMNFPSAAGGDGLNTGGFRFNAPVPVEQNAHTLRLDWNVTNDQKHQVSFRGNYQQDLTGVAPYLPDTPPTSTWSHPLGFAASHTWLIKGNLTNRASYGLTRIAFSNQGDSNDPAISFRSVYQPSAFTRAFDRTNPTQNITDDLTWTKGNHTFQFGTNIRLIQNDRTNFARAFDNGITNQSAYPTNIVITSVNQYQTLNGQPSISSAWRTNTAHALTALFGRLNGYGANINFDTAGALIAPQTGIKRIFETQEYDWYAQDTWKLRPNLTLTMGLRYGLSMPVTEIQGYETVPTIQLSEYLRKTIEEMNQGRNYRESLSVRKAGKSNGLDSIYPLDTNNWQPRVSIAWAPEFEGGVLGKLFGKRSESVFRAGFAITNDYFGNQLATNWDGANTLGFASSASINVNTYNITTNPAPLYTGPGMNIRALPNLVIPTSLSFPQTAPFTTPGVGKIETSLDQNLVSPINYSWNISYGRKLPGKIWIDATYVARLARNLLMGRDTMMLRDIRDPVSGMSYNEAATQLSVLMQAGAPLSAVPNIAFFNNMWVPNSLPGQLGCVTCTNNTQAVYAEFPSIAGDWTYMMQELDRRSGSRYFFQGQYDSLSAFGTTGSSDYHGATLSARQRLAGVVWDFNYTYSKSLDQSSGLQTGSLFGSTFVLNAFKLDDQRSFSDFDLRHMVNFNSVVDIPIGKGRLIGSTMNKYLNAILGGWSLSSVFRWDSGYPFDGFYDSTGWQTNWNIRSYMSRVGAAPTTGVFYNGAAASCTVAAGCNSSLPNIFANADQAMSAFRTPHPGETGSRNPLRYPSGFNLDAGLGKSFNMPWKEGHKMSIRWEVFNVTNTPIFDGQSVGLVGFTGSAAEGKFGQYTTSRNSPRIMQFALRYDF